MALSRPPEPKWNWRQPPSPYPECPGANTCLLGPSGSGKSYVLTALLLGPYKRVFQEIHVFSPSFGLDNIWDEVEKHAKSLNGPDFKSSFHDRFDEEALQEILTRQRARVTQLKKQKSQSPLPQIGICLDDLADTGHLSQAHNVVSTLFVRGRHVGCSTFCSVQKLTVLHPVIRTNQAAILVWALRNKKELWDGLIYELSNVADPHVLLEMYRMATEEKHSFWYVNLRRLPAEFYIRFEEKLEIGPEPPAKRHHGAPHEA